MNVYLILFFESVLSIAVSLSVLYVLSTPLVNVLCKICPDDQAAIFWLSYTRVMLIIAPLFLVLTVDMFTQLSDPVDSLRLTLMAVLCGLLISLYSVGKRLGQFVYPPQKKENAS